MEARGRAVGSGALALVTAAAVVLALAPDNVTARRPASASFQRAVGGLGLGPAVDLAGCAAALDPRLEGGCAADCGAAAGGGAFCPRHTGLLQWPRPAPGRRPSDS